MLFDELYEQLRKQSFFHLWFFFSYFDDFFSPTVRVKCYYTSYLHLRLFVWESLISFHFLNFVFISHLFSLGIYVCLSGKVSFHFIFLTLFSLVTVSGTNVKGMFCFQKVSCSFSLISEFLLLPQFHFQ